MSGRDPVCMNVCLSLFCILLLLLHLLLLLVTCCTSICLPNPEQAAGQDLGVVNSNRNCEPDVALEALHQLRTRLESTQKDLEDYKLKVNSLGTRPTNCPKSFLMIPVEAYCY